MGERDLMGVSGNNNVAFFLLEFFFLEDRWTSLVGVKELSGRATGPSGCLNVICPWILLITWYDFCYSRFDRSRSF